MSVRYPKKRGDEEEVRQASRSTAGGARQAAQEQEADTAQDSQETDIYGMAADNSVFGEAAADMDMKTPVSGEIRQAAQDVSADTRAASGDYLSDVYGDGGGDQGDEGDGGAPAPAEEEPQGLFEDVTDIDARQERERQAFADELAARKAEQQQQAEARAGLGGMGLSGATAELTADIGRQAERAGDIAMADLGRRQQQETFDELRRQASIWTFEEEFGVDLDGDGEFGSGEQKDEDTAGQEEIADIAGRQEKQKQSNQEKYDAYHNSVPTDPGAVAASNALGGIEAWKLANGAKELDRYRDENGVEYIVYELGDGTVVKGTSQGLVGTAADALFKEGAEA